MEPQNFEGSINLFSTLNFTTVYCLNTRNRVHYRYRYYCISQLYRHYLYSVDYNFGQCTSVFQRYTRAYYDAHITDYELPNKYAIPLFFKRLNIQHMKFKFNRIYFIYFLVLLAIEILIAIFLKSGFIRHTFGDYLVVILMFFFFKSFVKANDIAIGLVTLLIAYAIEFLQLTDILSYFGLDFSL